MNYFIEEQGPVQGWCQEIRLFATAATAAGPHLDRRTFVAAMAKIPNFPGGYSPVLTYGPDKFYGPTEYRVVRLHTNSPPSSQCKLPMDHILPAVLLGHRQAVLPAAHRLMDQTADPGSNRRTGT